MKKIKNIVAFYAIKLKNRAFKVEKCLSLYYNINRVRAFRATLIVRVARSHEWFLKNEFIKNNFRGIKNEQNYNYRQR